MEEKIKNLSKKLNYLLDLKSITIGQILKNKEKFDSPAVYAISKPNTKDVVYVGRTKNLTLRIVDHKNTDTKSDLRMMIKGKEGYPQDIVDYCVRYIKIENSRERMFFENFVIGVLEPKLNKEG